MSMTQTAGILTDLRHYFKSEPRISHAWLFGSFACNNSRENSDVDVMIEMKTDKPYTLFDIFDIQHRLERVLNRKVDLVEKDYINSVAWIHAKQNLITIL